MHHDKKVGLGLGILLLGIVGAFFFRNEPPKPKREFPELLTADELDREITQSGVQRPRPYTELDEFESQYQSGVKLGGIEAPEKSQASSISTPAVGPFDEEFNFLNDPVTTPPEPIKPAPETAVRDVAASNDELSVEHEMFLEDSPEPKPAQPAQPPKQQIYEVKPGDTLSEIAARFLGSQAKYHLIYEANSDQLKSPNDLKPGMKLVIPSPDQAADESERSVTSTRIPKRIPLDSPRQSRPIEPLPEISPGPVRLEKTITGAPPRERSPLKFERAQRNPLIPRRTNLRRSDPAPPSERQAQPTIKPAEQPISRQSTPDENSPSEKQQVPDRTKKPGSLPSLDGLEPLRIPSPKL